MPPFFRDDQEFEAVEERLENLEKAGYFLDDSALEMLATLSPAAGVKSLQEFEARMVAAGACCPSSTLAGLVHDMLDIKRQLAQLATAGLHPRFLECIAKLSTVEALGALQELEQAVEFLRLRRRIEE